MRKTLLLFTAIFAVSVFAPPVYAQLSQRDLDNLALWQSIEDELHQIAKDFAYDRRTGRDTSPTREGTTPISGIPFHLSTDDILPTASIAVLLHHSYPEQYSDILSRAALSFELQSEEPVLTLGSNMAYLGWFISSWYRTASIQELSGLSVVYLDFLEESL